MLRIQLIGLALVLSLVATSSCAGDLNQVKKNFIQRFPNAPVHSVFKSPVPGIYGVAVGRRIYYTDADVHYVFDGDLIDARTRENLTASRLHRLLRVDFAKLPLADAIKTVHGKGSRKLVVFADPRCPFCVRLEHTLQSVSNVTIYTFLYPIEQLHPGSSRLARAIWCAPDRAKAWRQHMLEGKNPKNPGTCPNPVARNLKLGEKLSIVGTPTLIFPDGAQLSGARSAKAIDAALTAAAVRK